MAEGGYYLSIGGETHGPYALEDLVAWQADGALDPSALVWDGAAWRPAAAVLGPSSAAAPTAVPAPPVARAGKRPLTPEAEADAIAKAMALSAGMAESYKTGLNYRMIATVVTAIGGGLALYFGSLAMTGAMGAKTMADVRNLKVSMTAAFAEGPPIGLDGSPYAPPPAATPTPLPPEAADRFRSYRLDRPWGHAPEYVAGEEGWRLLVPIGKDRDQGYLVGDPYTMGIWLWSPDSGPLEWVAVREVPEWAIP